ncbi:hypothetical protein BC749_106319 [Flavobacterium araucananum]|uniref:HEPN domain-containing protein n=1 Tax=Flavobacterium araucananum TaxID=946678 RepID=A0A227PFB0_9FLAO|nr:hypothetical protein [Flavobacterium araucananum]OXG08610.1 hypothetical protein B0A64_04065 [Flavobacterium araucananum]PWJ97908.1 hypothetical protein BC749_106319 [Flavobacterium araucananum]
MSNSHKFFERCSISASLNDLAYRDYIAARFLLNNEFILQGLTLASTAVEKYLKSILVYHSTEKKNYRYHFDNIEKLKNVLSNIYDIDASFDPVFLSILRKAYKIRYYDHLKEPILIGIYLNQFIGEFDAAIHDLEIFIMKRQNGNSRFTNYWRAIDKEDPNLFKNNYLLNQQDKKEFMETPGFAFSIHIQAGTSAIGFEKTVKSKEIAAKYEGYLAAFEEFQQEWEIK